MYCDDIQTIGNVHEAVEFHCVPNLAQYKGSDYANAVRVERGITIEEAKRIASEDPEVGYFVYVKGFTMVLEFAPEQEYLPEKDPLHLVTTIPYRFDDDRPGYGYVRLFHHGDVVFFKNEGKWLGTAPGLADVYEKVK
ncbi:MAG: hypothetical protein K1X28_01935 [Parachlamydiales bacterium]|nr:hypothetical protein [Parachlamydiales bacterium]